MRLPSPAPHVDTGLLVLRLGLATILLFHGVFKLTHGVAWIGGPLGAQVASTQEARHPAGPGWLRQRRPDHQGRRAGRDRRPAADGVARLIGAVGLPAFLAYGTYVAEIVAPALLILGVWTRAAALVIAFDLFMAVFLARRGDIGKINPMSGSWAIEVEALFFVMALTLALTGGGRYGIGKR